MLKSDNTQKKSSVQKCFLSFYAYYFLENNQSLVINDSSLVLIKSWMITIFERKVCLFMIYRKVYNINDLYVYQKFQVLKGFLSILKSIFAS